MGLYLLNSSQSTNEEYLHLEMGRLRVVSLRYPGSAIVLLLLIPKAQS